MRIFVTADLHLDHNNIIKYCHRPYEDAEEMAEAFLRTINEMCTERDDLYVLGDFAWHQNAFMQYAVRIRPRTLFLKGNHDYGHKLDYMLRLKHNKRKYLLGHFPLASLSPGYVNLHGHCHNLLQPELTWRLDVGIDSAKAKLGEYRPFHIDEVEELTKPFDRREEYGER